MEITQENPPEGRSSTTFLLTYFVDGPSPSGFTLLGLSLSLSHTHVYTLPLCSHFSSIPYSIFALQM